MSDREADLIRPGGGAPFLPLCLSTVNRRVLVIGHGREARLKVKMLCRYADDVVVCWPAVDDELRHAPVRWIERPYQPELLDGAALVYACSEDRELNRRIGADARARGILVNVVDDPKYCDVVTPALFHKDVMSVAVSSNGQDVRRSIAWRNRIRDLMRQNEPAMSERTTASTDDTPATSAEIGKVWLVGFGPGDPELITRRAHRVLMQADVLFYDDLVDAEALAEYPGRKHYVGKRGGHRDCTAQEAINDHLYRAAMRGECVARVKGGDPLVFGRAGEELSYLRDRGVSVEVIPGVSAAHAAAASAGISLTLRGVSRCVELRTVHGCSTTAKPQRTTVVYYMAAARLGEIARELHDEGWPENTPIALIESASLSDERCRITTLEALPGMRGASPLTLIVGDVVQLTHGRSAETNNAHQRAARERSMGAGLDEAHL